jgi:hypothetical protein
MKILLTLFLVLSSFLFSAQNNNDSHSQDFSNETNDSSVELEVTSTIHTASDLEKTSTNINEKTKSDLKKELIIIQNQSRNLVLFCFIIFSLVVLGLWYYFKKTIPNCSRRVAFGARIFKKEVLCPSCFYSNS